jgi:hypothetical protein
MLSAEPTIDQVHEGIKKERESSGVEMIACAVSLTNVRCGTLLRMSCSLPALD